MSVREQPAIERLQTFARREPRSALLLMGLVASLSVGLATASILWQRSQHAADVARQTLWDARRDEALRAQTDAEPLNALLPLSLNIAEAEAQGASRDAEVDRLRFGLVRGAAPVLIDAIALGSEGRSTALSPDGTQVAAGTRDAQIRVFSTADGALLWRARPAFPPTPWGPSFSGLMRYSEDGRWLVIHGSGHSGSIRPDTAAMYLFDAHTGMDVAERIRAAGLATTVSANGKFVLARSSQGTIELFTSNPWRSLGPAQTLVYNRFCLLGNRGRVLCAAGDFSEFMLLDDQLKTVGAFAAEADAEIVSWDVSADGKWFALGSSLGALWLVNGHTGAASKPLQTEASISAVRISADSRFITVGGQDGTVRLLDINTGSAAIPIRSAQAKAILWADFDPASRTLVSHDGRHWLSQLGASDSVSVQMQNIPHPGAAIGFYSVDRAPAHGLIATTASEGQLRLWRTPVLKQWHSSALAQGQIAFDGRTVLKVDGNSVQVVNASDGKPSGPPIVAAGPILFASTNAQGNRLLLAHGQVVETYSHPAHERLSSQTLPASVQIFAVHPQRDVAVVGGLVGTALRTRYTFLDLRDGNVLGSAFETQRPARRVRFDPRSDSAALINSTEVTLAHPERMPALTFLAAPNRSYSDATFAPDQRLLISWRGLTWSQSGGSELWQVSDSPTLVHTTDTAQGVSAVVSLAQSIVTHGPRPTWRHTDQLRTLADIGGNFTSIAELDSAQQIALLGLTDAVLRIDANAGSMLTHPINLPLPSLDQLSSIAPSGSASSLLRSHYGRQWLLPLTPAGGSTQALTRDAALYRSDTLRATTFSDIVLDNRQRAALRAQDPGEPLPRSNYTAPTSAIWSTRDGAATVLQLDLRGAYNVGQRQRFQGAPRGLGITDSAGIAHGLLQLGAHRVDLGGAIQLAGTGVNLGAYSFPAHSNWVRVEQSVNALIVIAALQLMPTGADESDALVVAFDYADGGTANVGLTAGRDIFTAHQFADASGEIVANPALLVHTAESRTGGGGADPLLVYSLRVPNPRPEQPVARLRFSTRAASPLILAATVNNEGL